MVELEAGLTMNPKPGIVVLSNNAPVLLYEFSQEDLSKLVAYRASSLPQTKAGEKRIATTVSAPAPAHSKLARQKSRLGAVSILSPPSASSAAPTMLKEPAVPSRGAGSKGGLIE